MTPLPPATERGKLVAPYLDHTLLKPDTTPSDVERLCREALNYGFCGVCVNPVLLPVTFVLLRGSRVKPVTVIGFPLGATSSAAKAFEAAEAVAAGALEVDMVVAIGALKAGQHERVRADIAAVVAAAGPRCLVKVILETCLLTSEEKTTACRLAVEAGAAFVKTSTGFAGGGATVADVRLMRAAVGPSVGVKASGGIKTLTDALTMMDAGASRIGSSSCVNIVTEL